LSGSPSEALPRRGGTLRGRRVPKAILLKAPIKHAVVLSGACFLAIVPLFRWGIPSGHDFEFHMFSWMEVLGYWQHGIVYPRWAALAHWGYGEARFLFYPPASWTLGAALGAVLPWKLVPGAYCWIVLTLAAAAMYRLAHQWLSAPDALFAAVFYALNPYHLLIVYWRSAYAELLAAPLLPLVLLCLLRLFSRKPELGVLPILWLSLTLAAAWLTNAPAAVMIYYSTAGLALVLVAIGAHAAVTEPSQPSHPWRPLLRSVLRTTLAMILGAGLASFYLVPAIYEQGWVNLSEVLSPGVRPQDNFLFTTLVDPDHNRFNLLVSTIAVVEIGALVLAIGGLAISGFATWFSKGKEHLETATAGGPETRSASGGFSSRTPWMLPSAWGAACAALMLSASNPLWQHLPKLRFVQLPFRWLLCMNAALAVLLTMATKRWSTRGLASAVLLAAVIIAGYRIQPPWWDTAADIREMSDAITNGSGYEGTDEYVPAGADPYELNKSLPRISDASGAAVRSEVLAWTQTEKHFTVRANAPANVTVRLFSYPAWEVVVNGKPTVTQTTDVTELIVIPVATGTNDVQIYFRRTIDRFVGNIVSLLSLLIFVVLWFSSRKIATPIP
jgi:hypothetical protein